MNVVLNPNEPLICNELVPVAGAGVGDIPPPHDTATAATTTRTSLRIN